MLSNRQIKLIQSLKQKKFRSEHQLFIAEGEKITAEVLSSNTFKIEAIYAVKEWIDKNELRLKQFDNVIEVSESELNKISQLTTANQVLMLLNFKMQENTAPPKWTIVIDTLQDPGNLGTIIRVADWFGINEIILSKNSVDLFNPKVIQSTMGSFNRVNVKYEDLSSWLLSQTREIYGAVLGGTNLYKTVFPESGILVLGNESKGISDELLKLINNHIEIPRKGGAESLNVSVACSIFSNEIMRQGFQQ